LILELLKKGETVHTVFSSPKEVPMSFLGKINLKYGFVKFDRDHDLDKGLPRKALRVFHIYDIYTGSFTRLFNANTSATFFLLDWAKRVGVSQFIFLSAGEVYGHGQSLNEAAPYNPRSFYATTKFHAETLARYYHRSFELKTARLFFPYGKGLAQGYIYNLVEAVKSQGTIETEYGMICPTCIDDIVGPLMKIADLGGNQVFNLCGSPMPVSTIIKAIENITGKTPKKTNAGTVELTGDNSRSREELGLNTTTFLDALASMFASKIHG
jgi:nucleoside-diphosphate-sugar epimerase